MASSVFDLAETQHILTRSNLKLITRTRLEVTLPDHSSKDGFGYDLATAGLWITRGNGLNLRVRADLDAVAHSTSLSQETFENALCETLTVAKLWSQLSLKASLIDPHHTRHQPGDTSELAFALTHLDSRGSIRSSMRPGSDIGAVANDHDIKPPAGVLNGFIDSVELTLTFSPLLPYDATSQSCNTRRGSGSIMEKGSILVPMQSQERHTLDKDEDGSIEGILFRSPSLEILSCDVEMLDSGEDASNKPPLSRMRSQPCLPAYSPLPSIHHTLQIEELPSFQHCALDPLHLLKLVDASLRRTFSGEIPPGKNSRRLNDDDPDIKLIQEAPETSLADISPALFRPGYMKIWHLLQKRKWPTTALQPLQCDDMDIFDRSEKDKELIFEIDQEGDEGLSLETRQNRNHEKYMLNTSADISQILDRDDGDLFFKYESMPSSSQDTVDEGMMEEIDEGEDLLFGDASWLAERHREFGVRIGKGSRGLGWQKLSDTDHCVKEAEFECLRKGCDEIEEESSAMAILDMKNQRDKLHQYQKRITIITDRETDIAKTCLARGDRSKALLALRRKKFQESLLAKTDAQLETLEQLTSNVEFALVQKDVIFGLQQGTAVLKQIHAEVGGIEHVEKLLGENEDARAYQREITEMLGGEMSNQDEDDVEDELEALEGQVRAVKQPDAVEYPTAPETTPEARTHDSRRKARAKERARERARARARAQAQAQEEQGQAPEPLLA
ncbi:MAG: hypothetical protein Q9166_003525 [cf. Caloplaca sp. 2 TL-2023]